MQNILIKSTLVTALLFSSAVFATDKAKDLITNLVGKGTIISEQFSSVGNLNGYVVKRKDSPAFIVYADKNGEYVVNGTIYNNKMQDVGSQDKQKYIIAKIAPKAMASLKDTAFVLQADKNKNIQHALTLVFEPNCSACHALYKSISPYIESGDISVRFVLVNFLKPSSKGRAAGIIQSANPVKALTTNEYNFNNAAEEGGAKVASKITAETARKLDASNKFMQEMGLQGTPAIIYYDIKGQLQIVEGVPSSKEAITQIINDASDKF